MIPEQNEHKAVILFDGVCNLCNTAIQTIIKNDKRDYFRFASLQSDIGKQLLVQYHLSTPSELESMVLIQAGKAYQYSNAVLRIARKLSGAYLLLYPFILLPSFLRNAVYKWIARNRYKWFGKQNECWLPTPELKQKFL